MATRKRAERLLEAALRAVPGAQARPGQRDMVLAVDTALRTAEHLLVQAGTGTGKSLGYLVPALASGKRVVVATATKALQSQLVEKDLPRLVKELDKELGRTPTFALAKGRGNYACLQQVHGGPGAVEEPEGLFEAPSSTLGKQVQRLRQWAETTQSGDRDDVPFPVSDLAWRQVSVSARDCLGSRCPDRVECFAERAKEAAKDVDVVVANHALLALDAFTGVQVLPEHDAVVLDEAHEFVAAATEALSRQVSLGECRRAAGAAGDLLSEAVTARLQDAQDGLEGLLATTEQGLIPALPPHAAEVLSLVETVFLAAAGELGRGAPDEDELDKARRERARTALTEVAESAAEIRAPGVPSAVYAVAAGASVLLRVSPLRVGGALATRLFGEKTVVATSATLTLGGSFRHTARGLGLTWLAGSPVGSALGPGEEHDRRDVEAVDEVLDGEDDAARTAVAAPRRRQPVRLPSPGPALGRLRAARPGPAAAVVGRRGRRDDHRAGAGGRRAHARAVHLQRRRRPGGRGRAGRDRPAGAAAGRGHRRRAGRAVRLGRPHLPVRHPVVLAGRRRAGQRLPAGGHRPAAVRPRRRPAAQGPARRGRPARLRRGAAAARRGPAGPGRRTPAALGHRPGRRRGARPAAGERRLRQGAARHAAAVLPGAQQGGGPGLAAGHRRPGGGPGLTVRQDGGVDLEDVLGEARDALRVSSDGGVVTVELHRPQRHNAINYAMWDAFRRLMPALAADDDVDVVVFRGTPGGPFSAGADISEFTTLRREPADAERYSEAVEGGEQAIIGFPKPTVALVQGWALGGGTQVAAACDLRVCDEGARFAVTPAKLGIVYALPSTARLVDVVGQAWASYFLLTGEQVDAATALRIGLVHEVLPAAEVEARAYALAGVLASRARVSPGRRQAADRPGRRGAPRGRRGGHRGLPAQLGQRGVRRGRRRLPRQARPGLPRRASRVTTGRTIGVEEEYQLVDAETMALADRPEVVPTAVGMLGRDAQGEISTSQLEIGTPVVRTLAEVRAEVVRLRRGADAAAREHGCRILAAGTHPTGTWRDQRLTPGVRYLELVERWRLLALQQLITGQHVHVGVEDPETAVRLLGHLRADLPVLLALSGSSPFWEGSDTGYASYRTLWYARWPVTGSPEVFASRAEYDALVADLVAAGMVDDASHLYWDARPSTRYPTVEVRVADTSPLVDDVVLHAGLARSLVRVAAGAAERDEQPPAVRTEVVKAARWRAARDGSDGHLLDVRSGTLQPAAEVVRGLLGRLRDDLEAAGEWDEVSALAELALARGSSAARQRAVLERTASFEAVVASVLEETLQG